MLYVVVTENVTGIVHSFQASDTGQYMHVRDKCLVTNTSVIAFHLAYHHSISFEAI
jgi:hypothetical protein